MENTKEQVVAEWKAINGPRLKEIKSANPDLYSAINLALNYLNKKLGGDELPVEVEELPFKVGDVFRRNLSTDVPPNTEITYTITEIGDDKIGVYVEFFAGNKNKPRNVFKKIEDVLEEIETGSWVLYEGQQIETKQWTREDFLNTKMELRNEDENKKYQELLLSLGFLWERDKPNVMQYTSMKYIFVEINGELLYGDDNDTFKAYSNRDIFYDDIFPSQTETSIWRFKTREELDAEGIDDFRSINPKYVYENYAGKPWDELYDKKLYKSLNEAINGYFKDGYSLSSLKYFTQNPLPAQSTANPETYPAQSELTYNYSFTPNKGYRKSPTQSAGELKKIAEKHSTSAVQIELLSTKFKGNDGNWYGINIGKTGTWTWKETTPPPAQTQMPSSTPENDFQLQLSKMTVAELNKLTWDTLEARGEFTPQDEEYNELTEQLVDIEKEIKSKL